MQTLAKILLKHTREEKGKVVQGILITITPTTQMLSFSIDLVCFPSYHHVSMFLICKSAENVLFNCRAQIQFRVDMNKDRTYLFFVM